MLTIKDVAARLSVSATCVYQLVASRKLACHRIGIGRGAIRICESDLEKFVDDCRQENVEGDTQVRRRTQTKRSFKHLRVSG